MHARNAHTNERTSSDPLPRRLEARHDLLFLGAHLRGVVVLPTCSLRQRHQDALQAPNATGQHLEAEGGATVVHKVELHVSAPPHLLPILLLLSELVILVLLKDGDIGLGHGIKAFSGELEVPLLTFSVEVVKEDTTQSAGLSTVRDKEITVRPLFELRIPSGIVLVANILVGPMEVFHVVLVQVRRCNVSTTAEPPQAEICLEVAVIEMHRWAHWILGVHHR
mmetsp:Transcript_9963/g.24797  ORF Transcript_9963/g.24797 Transcript_9963/m.24797 type:complete len:223 (-) Transcript_9963:731-1399(-)